MKRIILHQPWKWSQVAFIPFYFCVFSFLLFFIGFFLPSLLFAVYTIKQFYFLLFILLIFLFCIGKFYQFAVRVFLQFVDFICICTISTAHSVIVYHFSRSSVLFVIGIFFWGYENDAHRHFPLHLLKKIYTSKRCAKMKRIKNKLDILKQRCIPKLFISTRFRPSEMGKNSWKFEYENISCLNDWHIPFQLINKYLRCLSSVRFNSIWT